MTTLDHITAASQRAFVYGLTEIGTYHARMMDDAARLQFDGHLVAIGHQLAWQAGTPESRFVAYVGHMVEMEQERRRLRVSTLD